ncbi:MAG: hypothetical protein ABI960_04345 [Candidatus Eisenbacteria bacterium]
MNRDFRALAAAGELCALFAAGIARADTPVVTKGVMKNAMIFRGRFLESRYKGEFQGQPFEGPDKRVYTMFGKIGEQEVPLMEITYTRAKKK